MASGSNRLYHGNYCGTGATKQLTDMGFCVRSMRVTSEADGSEYWWNEDMDHEGWARDAAGAVTKFAAGSGTGFVQTDLGVELGTGALNTADVTYFFTCAD